MTIEEILALTDISKIVDELKKRITPKPDITTIKNEWEIAGHDVMSETERPDKKIYKDDGVTLERLEKVGRIPIAFQELIVNRALSFLFGNPVELQYDTADATIKPMIDAVNKVHKTNRELAMNRNVGLGLMRSTEVAEVWYVVKQENNLYGVKSSYKLKHMVFDPYDGNTLYPLFDETGDLIAFSREFVVKENGKEITYFDTYTAERILRFKETDKKWEQIKNDENLLKKIPVVYGTQGVTEWGKVQKLINRLETLASNFADTNDYHGSPTIMIEGEVSGFAKKGEQGKILQASQGSKAYYLAWDRAPEAIKLEKDMLIEMIYTLTQTPNLTFDNVKGLGDISGVALRLLFLDAHLKVESKKKILIEYMSRRLSIIKAFLSQMNPALSELADAEINPEIIPYLIPDRKGNVELALLANGNNPVISQKTSVELAGLATNVSEELKVIDTETTKRNTFDISAPTE